MDTGRGERQWSVGGGGGAVAWRGGRGTFALLALPLLLLLPACEPEGPGFENPGAAVVTFFRAHQAGNVEAAMACLHPESPLREKGGWRKPEALAAFAAELAATKGQVQIVDIEQTGSRARVSYRLVKPEAGGPAPIGTVEVRHYFPPGEATGPWLVWDEVTGPPFGARPPIPAPSVDLPQVETPGPAPGVPEAIHVVVAADRTVRVDGKGPLDIGTIEGLKALRAAFQERTSDPAWREPDRSSRRVLLVEADRSVPWERVGWVLQLGADPTIGLYRIAFRVRSPDGATVGALPLDLPKDRGPVPSVVHREEPPGLVLKLFRMDLDDPVRARTTIRVSNTHTFDLPAGAWTGRDAEDAARKTAYDSVFAEVRAVLRTLRERMGGGPDTVAEVRLPMPKGPAVPCGDVVLLLDSVRRIGVDRILLGGSPSPLPAPGQGGVIPAPAAGGGEDPDLPYEEPPGEGIGDAPFEEEPGGFTGLGGGYPGPFLGRLTAEARARRGATPETEAAVDAALRWLAAHQSPNGGWEGAGFGKWCDGKPAPSGPEGAGKVLYDVGLTGLALDAFLGAGYTNRGKHPYAKVVAKGLRYLKNVQDPEGCFGPRQTQHYIYNHATAALAMVEVYGLTGSPIFKGSAQKALDFLALARNPYFAWRYGVKPGDNDTSVTGWAVAALHAAKAINDAAAKSGRPPPLAVDEEALAGALAWVGKMTDLDYGRTGYIQRGGCPARPQELIDKFPGDKSEAMTGAGMLIRLFGGEDPATSDALQKGAALCAKLSPTWNPADGSIDMYYWYYASHALFQVGGRPWEAWNAALTTALLGNQRKDGDPCGYQGSWDPIDPWGPDGGRVYSTALCVLCLEAYYRYDRLLPAR